VNGYPTSPVVEVPIDDEIYLMTEEQVDLFQGFTEIERRRYLNRIKDAKRRAVNVATDDGEFLTWQEYNQRTKGGHGDGNG